MPFRSTLARSAGKLLGVFKERDLSLRGAIQSTRFINKDFNATGGSTYISGTGYTVHVFTASGAFTKTSPASTSMDAEVIIIAGGGGGGRYGGGGGAGGFVLLPSQSYPGSAVPVTIGPGGAGRIGGAQSGERGSSGSPSSAFGITAYGGGAAGSYGDPAGNGSPGLDGGSGGGGGTNNNATTETGGSGNTPSLSPPQGNDGGGGGHYVSPGGGGGGGGAGGAGNPGPGGNSNGGVGAQAPTNFRSPTNPYGTPGPNPGGFYFAGGGAGVSDPTSSTGGSGGGGNGADIGPHPFTNIDGTANTGGGGGGTEDSVPTTGPPSHRAGDGATGIVLIAYTPA